MPIFYHLVHNISGNESRRPILVSLPGLQILLLYVPSMSKIGISLRRLRFADSCIFFDASESWAACDSGVDPSRWSGIATSVATIQYFCRQSKAYEVKWYTARVGAIMNLFRTMAPTPRFLTEIQHCSHPASHASSIRPSCE